MSSGTQAKPYGKLLDYEQFIDHQIQRTRTRIKVTDIITASLTLLVAFLGRAVPGGRSRPCRRAPRRLAPNRARRGLRKRMHVCSHARCDAGDTSNQRYLRREDD